MLFLEETLRNIVDLAILLFEYIGVGIIIFAGVRGIITILSGIPIQNFSLQKDLPWGWSLNWGVRFCARWW